MTESDLAVHLSRQTELPVGSIPFTTYSSADAVASALAETDAAAAVLDALDDAHLELLGAALALLPSPVFAVGSGGLSHAVAAARPGNGPAIPTATSAHGPVLAVSGSRSPQTRRQVEHARAAGWFVAPLDLDRGADAGPVLEALAAGRSAVLTSDDADASGVAPGAVLETIAATAAKVILAAARADLVHRVIVCGGDTSSRVTRLLGVGSLSIAANPWGNIVLLRAHAADPAIDGLELLLKGGQVGAADLLERVSPPR